MAALECIYLLDKATQSSCKDLEGGNKMLLLVLSSHAFVLSFSLDYFLAGAIGL